MHNRLIYMFKQKMGIIRQFFGQTVLVGGNTCVTNVNKNSDGNFQSREVLPFVLEVDVSFSTQNRVLKFNPPTLVYKIILTQHSLSLMYAVTHAGFSPFLQYMCYIINFNDFFRPFQLTNGTTYNAPSLTLLIFFSSCFNFVKHAERRRDFASNYYQFRGPGIMHIAFSHAFKSNRHTRNENISEL